ncbi:MAG: hypothetical protein K2W82_17985 [Candidatus Obscuribacterales bacterium]|nr:hypothetical protein [Candidatus Obscuribacterales bacterium]
MIENLQSRALNLVNGELFAYDVDRRGRPLSDLSSLAANDVLCLSGLKEKARDWLAAGKQVFVVTWRGHFPAYGLNVNGRAIGRMREPELFDESSRPMGNYRRADCTLPGGIHLIIVEMEIVARTSVGPGMYMFRRPGADRWTPLLVTAGTGDWQGHMRAQLYSNQSPGMFDSVVPHDAEFQYHADSFSLPRACSF